MIYTSPIEKPAYRDAFGRFRVSTPEAVFDSQFTYDAKPLIYEQVTSGGGSITHDATNRVVNLDFTAATTGDTAYMQSFDFFRYQPGKSQNIAITFNMKEAVANCVKFVGYSDGNNGMEFILDGTTPKVRILSDTSLGDETVSQANWNLDTLDGKGPSRKTLDISKIQILVIDFQALYSGRMRIGFDMAGETMYVHEFLHANVSSYPYIQTANLPIRVGMIATGNVTTDMDFICSAISSEGGQQETFGHLFSTEGTATAANGADTHILSIQPKTTFNSLVNRTDIALQSIDLLVTGNSPILYKICLGQALTSTSTADVNTAYSATETITGTLSGIPALVLSSGYVAATGSTKDSLRVANLKTKLPITLDAAGNQRDLGRITVLVQGIGGNSATRVSLNWKEIR